MGLIILVDIFFIILIKFLIYYICIFKSKERFFLKKKKDKYIFNIWLRGFVLILELGVIIFKFVWSFYDWVLFIWWVSKMF